MRLYPHQHAASPLVKDVNGPDVHNGPKGTSDPTSNTSRTGRGEIHTTLVHAPYGIAGGLTEDERSAARTSRRDGAAVGTVQHDTDNDPIMVDRVARSGRQPGATREELAAAAVRLVEGGQSIVQVAERLGLAERTVSTYAAAARAAQQQVAS